MTRHLALAAAAILLVLVQYGASAAPSHKGDPASNALVRALEACRDVADPTERLSCFDAASRRLSEAVDRKELVILDKQEIRQTKRSLFGFTVPRIGLFRGDDGGEQSEIVTKITSVRNLGNGKWQIRITEGATWETTEASMMISDPRNGNEVRIKKGPLGSYLMRIAGQRALRAKRVG
jgi:hypothetical protein